MYQTLVIACPDFFGKGSILNKIKDYTIETPRSVGAAMVIEINLAKQLILMWV